MLGEGQTLSFNYLKAGNGPTRRLGLVIEKLDNYFRCFDYAVDDYRTFNYDHVVDAKRVADVGEEVVKPETLVVKPDGIPGDLMVALYRAANPETINVYFDAECRVLVVRKRYEPTIEVVVNGADVKILFGNEKGVKTGYLFKRPNAEPMGTAVNLVSKLTPATAWDLVRGITDLFQDFAATPAATPDTLAELLKKRLYQG